MKEIYEIVKVVGLGLIESPYVEHSTGLIFFNNNDAEREAHKLWIEQTSEEEKRKWMVCC